MCEECGRYVCAISCPNFNGHSAIKGGIYGTCGICGKIIYYNDAVFRKGEMLLCSDCAPREHRPYSYK